MSEVDLKQKITGNLEYLVKNTHRLKMLVSELVSCDLLTFDQADTIMEEKDQLGMHEKMYTFVMQDSSSSGFTKLLKALKASGNGHLTEILEK